MEQFITKYRPKKSADIIGQESKIKELKDFIINYQGQKKRAILIYGQSGIGKTSSVHSLANELGLELVEVNASEFRNQEQILLKIGNAIKQKSLFSKGKIILVDEVDGIAGVEDRGGMQTILRLIAETKYPMILTINDPFHNKFSTLRNKCYMLMFEPINYQIIEGFLRKICNDEKLNIDDGSLRTLARISGGDLMSALNDLQSISGKGRISEEDIKFLSHRDKQEPIQQALGRIFKTTDINISIFAFDNVKEDVDEQFLWIDENLPKEYSKVEDLVNAYESLSKADIFRRRIRINQYYRFLVYINAYITIGISLSKIERYTTVIKYSQTGRLLKIFWANQRSLKRKEIAKKLAKKIHCSVKDAIKGIYNFKVIFRANKKMANAIANELELSQEEIEWLGKF
ncbi:MAG: replication factor C large subunit [Nanoarchaeota archaeon]